LPLICHELSSIDINAPIISVKLAKSIDKKRARPLDLARFLLRSELIEDWDAVAGGSAAHCRLNDPTLAIAWGFVLGSLRGFNRLNTAGTGANIGRSSVFAALDRGATVAAGHD
jgi:hypothetical protein